MSRASRTAWIVAGLGLGLWLGALPTLADLAKVYPKKGSPLRGEVTATATEIIIRNAAGEVRLKKADVQRVEWVSAAQTVDEDFLRRFNVLVADDAEGHYALAEWLRVKNRFDLLKKQCNYVLGLAPDHRNAKLLLELAQRELVKQANVEAGAGQPEKPQEEAAETDGLPAPPLLSERDIKRVKLYEYPLDGPAEKVHVRFVKKKGYADLERVVRAEIGRSDDPDPDADRILQRGQPHEKLQLILRATGLKYADQIEIRGDTEVFKTFKRQVLPLVAKGCTKSGCHGTRAAQVFRLPSGPRTKDDVAYTSFLILDRLETRHGPLIDRDLPPNSALLEYMLPREESEQPHPPVQRGKLIPPLRGTGDPNYHVILKWISSSLNAPHPEYELEYKYPDWLKKPEPPATQPAEEAKPGAEEEGEKKPAEEGKPEPGKEKPGQEEPPEGEKPKDKPGGGGGDKP
ncbi:MAG TPA: hypothetical protein VM487_11210 [Phycisphaerae bacterium]|nr:hypothetical protein [Phycisphaerae bacterium]